MPEKAVSALAAVTDNVVIDEIPAQVPVEEAVVEDVVVEETPVTEIPVEEKVTVPVKQEEKPVTEFRTDHDGEDWSGPEYIDVIGKDRRSWKKRSPSAGLSLSSAARTASAENILDTKKMTLSPNPTNGFVKISTKSEAYEILIINSLGQIIDSYQISGNETTISIEDIPAGVYFINLLDRKKNTLYFCSESIFVLQN